MSSVFAIIAAAGSSSRMGVGQSKVMTVVNGLTVIERTVRPFLSLGINCMLVCSKDIIEEVKEIFSSKTGVSVILGGATRGESVSKGLKAIEEQFHTEDSDIVLVHDAARCLVSNDLIERVIADSRLKGATVPGVKITDSIKRVSPTGSVESNIDRENLVVVQTPQGFHFSILKKAYSTADYSASDDSSLVEKFCTVSIIPGEKNNIKITYPEDLAHAEMILRQANRDIL